MSDPVRRRHEGPSNLAADVRREWQLAAPYLNTASYGLPPRSAWDELQQALNDWRAGRTSWEHWGESTERARRGFARLAGVQHQSVAVGATVSELVGLVATALHDGARVIGAHDDFTSLLFPFAVHADRRVDLRTVPLETLPGVVAEGADLVAVSAVQSVDGRLAALDEIAAAVIGVGIDEDVGERRCRLAPPA